jgi:hypothetical protein
MHGSGPSKGALALRFGLANISGVQQTSPLTRSHLAAGPRQVGSSGAASEFGGAVVRLNHCRRLGSHAAVHAVIIHQRP